MNNTHRIAWLESDLIVERQKNARLEALVEYLSMMTEVDIPIGEGEEYEQPEI